MNLFTGGRGETDTCACIPQPAQRIVSLGDSVRPPCFVINGTALVTMTCSVYNSTNIVDTSHSACECHINFTAERVGPLELSCDIVCTQGVITFSISWTVVGKYVHTYVNVGNNNCSQQLKELEDAWSEHIHSVSVHHVLHT